MITVVKVVILEASILMGQVYCRQILQWARIPPSAFH